MAELIGATSGILTLIAVTYKSGLRLHDFLNGLKNAPSAVRALRDEAKSIAGVLQSLHDTISEDDHEFDALKIPILHCGQACLRFQTLLEKLSSAESTSSRWKDWLKLQYMGKDINEFKDMLSGYKATISIAIGDANLRQMRVSQKALAEYQQFILDTTVDLQQQYESTQEKLSLIKETCNNESHSAEEQDIRNSLIGAQQCIAICTEVSEHIEQARSRLLYADNAAVAIGSRPQELNDAGIATFAELLTMDTFKLCRNNIAQATREIEGKLATARTRISRIRGQDQVTEDMVGLEAELNADLNSVNDRLNYLKQATLRTDRYRTNHFEDISIGDNSHQALVSTIGDLISAKRITTGSGSTSWMGQMSDETLQLLSRNRWGERENMAATEGESLSSGTDFGGRYGVGKHLGGDK